jgi:Ni,Fe-hydrogenase III small subunit
MEEALRRTYDAMPDPKLVVAVGDCAACGGFFVRSYATRGSIANVIPVNHAIAGCPPSPAALLGGILQALSSVAR